MRQIATILLTSVLFVCGGPLIAQEQDPGAHSPEGWIAVGIGTCYFGPSLSGYGAYYRNGNFFSVRYVKADELRFGVENNFDEPTLSFKELGILYGRYLRNDRVALGLSAGLGFARGTLRGQQIALKSFPRENFSTVSVPFELSVRVDLGGFALGGAWFGSLNKSKSFSGAMIRLLVRLV